MPSLALSHLRPLRMALGPSATSEPSNRSEASRETPAIPIPTHTPTLTPSSALTTTPVATASRTALIARTATAPLSPPGRWQVRQQAAQTGADSSGRAELRGLRGDGLDGSDSGLGFRVWGPRLHVPQFVENRTFCAGAADTTGRCWSPDRSVRRFNNSVCG